METDTTTQSELPNGGEAIVEQKLASEERNNLKEKDCENHSLDPSRKGNHLNKVVWDRKGITEFTRSVSSTIIG